MVQLVNDFLGSTKVKTSAGFKNVYILLAKSYLYSAIYVDAYEVETNKFVETYQLITVDKKIGFKANNFFIKLENLENRSIRCDKLIAKMQKA